MNNISNIIYLIDDDEAICKSIKWLLEALNLQVKIFYNPLNFLKEYTLNLKGCLLIDVRMPEMSGLQLQERLASLGNKMPIIMLSGLGDASIRIQALKAGAIDFITKPFSSQVLLERIQNIL